MKLCGMKELKQTCLYGAVLQIDFGIIGLYQSLNRCPSIRSRPQPVDPFGNSEYDNPMDGKAVWDGADRADGGCRRSICRLVTAFLAMAGLGLPDVLVEARDLMVPKEQATTEFEPTEAPSLDV